MRDTDIIAPNMEMGKFHWISLIEIELLSNLLSNFESKFFK